MKHLNNLVVVVGDNRENSGKYSTQLNPVKLEENVGIAIISIFHSTICNINSENQYFSIRLPIETGEDREENPVEKGLSTLIPIDAEEWVPIKKI